MGTWRLHGCKMYVTLRIKLHATSQHWNHAPCTPGLKNQVQQCAATGDLRCFFSRYSSFCFPMNSDSLVPLPSCRNLPDHWKISLSLRFFEVGVFTAAVLSQATLWQTISMWKHRNTGQVEGLWRFFMSSKSAEWENLRPNFSVTWFRTIQKSKGSDGCSDFDPSYTWKHSLAMVTNSKTCFDP